MQMKSLYGTALGLLAASVLFMCNAGQLKSQTQTKVAEVKADTTKTSTIAPVAASSKIVVYYFHGNARCPTCFKLENFAKSEIEEDFKDAIQSGKLEWKTVNVEEKGNEHFADEYKLYTKSVIVSNHQNGKETSWKNLDKIWQLVQNESSYRQYIKMEIKTCLQGKCL
jgi:hypothetical protein